MRAIRWSDNDRYFGPFTYASNKGGFARLAVVLSSGDGDDYPGCRLRLSGFGHTLILALPAIIKPWRRWVDTSHYEWSKGSKGYWDTGNREYGFTLGEGHLSVAYGRSTDDSSTEQRWGYFLPWTQWRHVRRSLYDLNGDHFWTYPEGGSRLGSAWRNRWTVEQAVEGVCPSASFEFNDFDGELITAKTRVEEREWRFGERKFKWLSLFRRPRIRRSLDIQFSAETGKRKGSWKGGTIGHSIDMLPGELHEAAFRRYCAEHSMKFVASVDTRPEGQDPQGLDACTGSAVGKAETPNTSS